MSKQHPRGGGPKFLERALLTVAPRTEKMIATRVESRTSRGLGGGKL